MKPEDISPANFSVAQHLSRAEGDRGVKLLFFSPQALPSIGGLQYVVHYWAAEMSRLGYEVTVLTDTPGSFEEDALQSYRIIRNAGFSGRVKWMWQADKILMFNVSLKGIPAWIFSGKPLYVTHHTALWYESGPKPFRQKLKQWVANHLANGNCACSAYIASLYEKCSVIYSPFRSDVFVAGNQIRKPGSVLFVGRLVSDKGADLLVRAFARLVSNQKEISLTVAGDGPEREALEKMVSDLGIMEQVQFAGKLSQPAIIGLMQTHQLMVVPSRMEPMGMVVAEGLACGCRMVVSDQGGMPEVGGPFCRYFDSGSVDSLSLVITQQLYDPLPVDEQAVSGHLKKFSIEHSAASVLKWLKND